MRFLTRLVVLVAVAGTALVAPAISMTPSDTARAADLSYFDPGNIISDAVFFDSLAMDGPAVQAFLNAKGARCAAGEMPCIKDYRQDTATMAADSLCAGYAGAQGETAATIITKVARSCGISPRVLLVLLQKEQSLITRTAPTVYAYTKATGMGCPDTAPCNPAFAGFVSQVYFAARQYQNYRVNPTKFGKRAGQTSTISYYPATETANNLNDVRCGNVRITMANQATAGLYNYTPYAPNQAALNAGYGTGDACSSYGNRNFWNYFTDWFGSTQSTGGAAIYTFYVDQGGAGGKLGPPVTSFFCGIAGGGCYQVFTYGSVYWSPASGAHSIMGDLGAGWGARGWENGTLGYPLSEGSCGLVRGGCWQVFQGGSLYWSPGSGAHFVRNAIRGLWGSTGWEGGWLGYPITDEVCGLRDSGCFNHFEGGSVYSSNSGGLRAVNRYMRDKWGALGWEGGTLGYPVANTLCGLVGGGCLQDFQGGRMYWSPASGAAFTRGPVQASWEATGTQDGPLGYPVGDVTCGLRADGCAQPFQRGWMIWSASTGGRVVLGDVGASWFARGAQESALGYPIGDLVCGLVGGGCIQDFQGGRIYWTAATGAHLVKDQILTAYEASSSQDGVLGYAITDQVCGIPGGGCFVHFQGGSIYWSPSTGARPVTGAIREAWAASGWQDGRWGYPSGDAQSQPGRVTQRFVGGTATLDTTTGRVTFG